MLIISAFNNPTNILKEQSWVNFLNQLNLEMNAQIIEIGYELTYVNQVVWTLWKWLRVNSLNDANHEINARIID